MVNADEAEAADRRGLNRGLQVGCRVVIGNQHGPAMLLLDLLRECGGGGLFAVREK